MSDIFKNENIYKFSREGRSIPDFTFRQKIWQIGPSSIASLICVPFGIMLGWPSPTYPKLVSTFAANSPINITIDQSAMIAGFLMIGNILGTPFSSVSVFGTKYGLSIGVTLMLAGWIIMRFATTIYFLLGSRLLVGLGCGYGVGQLKLYINDMTQPPFSHLLSRLIVFYTIFGIMTAFVLGYLTTFTFFSTVAIIITSSILILCLFLPHSPKEYLVTGKEYEAKKVLLNIKTSRLNVDHELERIKVSLDSPQKNMTLLQVCKNKNTKKYVMILWILTVLQQFTGAPSTLIYTQVIFMESNCPNPELCAISYSVVFFASYFLGTFFMNTFNKKACLLFSSVSVTITLALNIIVLYFKLNEIYWRYTSLITMFLFIFVHTTGLAVVPFMLTHIYFPPEAISVISKVQIMQHSVLALIITKIFQVLYDVYDLYVPFCLFLCISIISSIFIWFVVPYNVPCNVSVLDKGIKLTDKSPQVL